MFARGILTLWLAAAVISPLRPVAHSPARVAQTRLVAEHVGAATPVKSPTMMRHEVAKASARRTRQRRHLHAAARAVERRLLLVASRTKFLAHFVDQSTGLVKRNVTARCKLVHRRQGRRHSVYFCRVWRHPRPPSSGAKVLCRNIHKRFVVMAYHRP